MLLMSKSIVVLFSEEYDIRISIDEFIGQLFETIVRGSTGWEEGEEGA